MDDRRAAVGEASEYAFGPVQHRSLPETALIEVRRAIINGKVAPGDHLVEMELAAQMGVSRATVRQALRHLEVEGLVHVRPRRGAVVARMASEDALAVCEVRGALEGVAARTACVEMDDEQRREMERLAAHMGEAMRENDVFRLVELDIAFHSIITKSSPNRVLYRLWSQLNAQHGALMASRLASLHPDWRTVVDLHTELCAVLAQRNPDTAEQAVRWHYAGIQFEQHEAMEEMERATVPDGL